MKRFFRILLLLVVLIIGLMAVVPIFFKDQIVAKAKEEANKNINAKVDFEDVSINLFSSFPNFHFGISQVTIDGKGEFAGVRLADIGGFNLELDLFSVLSGNQMQVEGISIINTSVNVIVTEEGTANYDIATTDEAAAETPEEEASDFKLKLKYYTIENFNLHYRDDAYQVGTHIRGLNHSGTGDFTEEVVALQTQTNAQAVDVIYEGIGYFKNTALKADLDLEYHQANTKVVFSNGVIHLNDFPLLVDGYVAMPNDEDIAMDLTYSSPEATFKSLLSLIPAVYSKEFAGLESSGSINFDGYARGTYNEEAYPAFAANVKVSNGQFQYPDLPAGVEDVNIDLQIESKTNNLDGMRINMPQAQAKIAGNPIDMKMKLATLMSNPTFDVGMKAALDLANLTKVVPAPGYDYRGMLNADFALAGTMNQVENEQYDQLKAQGNIILSRFNLAGDSVPMRLQIDTTHLSLSPQYAALSAFSATTGASDFAANGRIDNLVGYALAGELLTGEFSLMSRKIDMRDFGESAETESSEEAMAESDSTLAVVRIPKNINFNMSARIDTLIYDNLVIENVEGGIVIEDGMAILKNLDMNLLGGSMALNGFYNSTSAAPEVDFEFSIAKFSFKESYQNLATVQQLAPIMKSTTGNYSTRFNFKSVLNPDMTPDLASAAGAGKLMSSALSTSPKATQELAATLQNPSLSALNLNGLEMDFTIKDGRVEVKPFNIKNSLFSAEVSGSSGLDQSLDYVMDMKIPASKIGVDEMLSKIGGANISSVPVLVKITGTNQNPKVSTSVKDLGKAAVNNLKDQAKDKVKDVKKEVTDKIDAKKEQLIAEATKKGDALVAQAEKQATQIRAKGAQSAQQIRNAANKQAEKIENEAGGNPLKKAAAKKAAQKVRKEGEEKAQKVEREANNKADKVVKEARDKRQQLINEAKNKTD